MRDVEFGEASSSSAPHDRSGPTQSLLEEDDNDCSSSAVPPPSSSSSSSPQSNNDRRTNRRIRHGGASSSSSTTPPPPSRTDKDEGFGSSLLDSLPPSHQMALVSFLMFLFFGMHNVLQEAIVNLLNVRASEASATEEAGAGATMPPLASDRNWTIMLGYAEVVGVLAFSYLERVRLTTEGGTHRVAPLSAYPLLTLCLFASSSLSNLSLGYINFPTKVGE